MDLPDNSLKNVNGHHDIFGAHLVPYINQELIFVLSGIIPVLALIIGLNFAPYVLYWPSV